MITAECIAHHDNKILYIYRTCHALILKQIVSFFHENSPQAK